MSSFSVKIRGRRASSDCVLYQTGLAAQTSRSMKDQTFLAVVICLAAQLCTGSAVRLAHWAGGVSGRALVKASPRQWYEAGETVKLSTLGLSVSVPAGYRGWLSEAQDSFELRQSSRVSGSESSGRTSGREASPPVVITLQSSSAALCAGGTEASKELLYVPISGPEARAALLPDGAPTVSGPALVVNTFTESRQPADRAPLRAFAAVKVDQTLQHGVYAVAVGQHDTSALRETVQKVLDGIELFVPTVWHNNTEMTWQQMLAGKSFAIDDEGSGKVRYTFHLDGSVDEVQQVLWESGESESFASEGTWKVQGSCIHIQLANMLPELAYPLSVQPDGKQGVLFAERLLSQVP